MNLIKINKNAADKITDKNTAAKNADKINVEVPYLLLKLPARLNSPPVISNDKIYAAVENDSILVLSAGTVNFFSKLYTLPYRATILNSFDNFLLFGDRDGRLALYDSVRRKIIWRRRYGGKISSITKTENTVLVTSLDNFAYLISLNKGKTLWKKRLNGRVVVKPLIAENYLSIVVDTNNNVYVIDLKDGKVVNQIALPENITVSRSPIDFGEFLILPTNSGLYKVSNWEENCPPR